MFVISGVATDNRAVSNSQKYSKLCFNSALLIELICLQIGELAGLAVGATVLLNVLVAG